MPNPWDTDRREPVDSKWTEVADRLDVLNASKWQLVAKISKALREGLIEQAKTIYWNQIDKFRSAPQDREIAKFIEIEIIGEEEVRKTLSRGAGDF